MAAPEEGECLAFYISICAATVPLLSSWGDRSASPPTEGKAVGSCCAGTGTTRKLSLPLDFKPADELFLRLVSPVTRADRCGNMSFFRTNTPTAESCVGGCRVRVRVLWIFHQFTRHQDKPARVFGGEGSIVKIRQDHFKNEIMTHCSPAASSRLNSPSTHARAHTHQFFRFLDFLYCLLSITMLHSSMEISKTQKNRQQ